MGSDTHFAAVLYTAPAERAEGSANWGSDPKNSQTIGSPFFSLGFFGDAKKSKSPAGARPGLQANHRQLLEAVSKHGSRIASGMTAARGSLPNHPSPQPEQGELDFRRPLVGLRSGNRILPLVRQQSQRAPGIAVQRCVLQGHGGLRQQLLGFAP